MILGIYGAGGLGCEVLELALDIQEVSDKPRWENVLFLVDEAYLPEDPKDREIHGVPILSAETFFREYSTNKAEIVIAQGEPAMRCALREKVQKAGYRLATLIHPSVRLSRWAKVGEGCVITYGCNVSVEVEIMQNTYLQPSCGMGHNAVAGEDCVISACARIAGNVRIGARTYIGMQSTLRERINVGDDVIISMGSVVQRDIESAVIVMGNPARVVQKNERNRVF